MNKNEFLEKWNAKKDEETDIELKDGDLFTVFSGFAFVVQKDGNVVFKKVEECNCMLREVFRIFRLWCKVHDITHIRIEGSLRRYNFLQKMFPFCSFVRDYEIQNRNVFYVRL